MVDNLIQLNDNIDQLSVSSSLCCKPEECSSHIRDPSKQLKLVTQNIRSINANFDSFLTLLVRLNLDIDIIILTECWLKHSSCIIPPIATYSQFQTKLVSNQNDGVVIYVKNLDNYIVYEPQLMDASCLVLKIGTERAFVCIYRSPSISDPSNFLNSLDSLLVDLSYFPNIVVVGDINLDISSKPCTHHIAEYLNLIAFHGLLPAHSFPTRDTACLDHVMLKSKMSAIAIVMDSSVTDHNCVLLCLQSKKAYKQQSTFSKIDYVALDKNIHCLDFQPLYACKDPNEASNLLLSPISALISSYSSIIKVSNLNRLLKPWMTLGMLRCMRNRDEMHKKLKLSPNNAVLQTTYKRYRNFCTKILKKLRRDYESSEIREAADSNDNKKIWQVIKRVTCTAKPKSASTDLLSSSSSPQESVNQVNDFFANIGANLAAKFPNHNDGLLYRDFVNSVPYSFAMLDTEEGEVDTIISTLKSNSAVGWDNIPSNFLKRYKQLLVPPLTYFFNVCLRTGTFPESLKKAIIHPIHKNGNRNCVDNYRPIAVLPSISKILERIINNRLISYLEGKRLLSPNQFGFRHKTSTSSAVMELTSHIVNKMDSKEKVLSIFLDLKKAFDTVSIPILISKLEGLGIRGVALEIFKDYLHNRTQCVKILNFISNDLPVTFGVPQGSVVGPSLFLVYINQLCNLTLLNGKITVFADDTVLTFSGATWHETFEAAQSGMNIVVEWLRNHLLTLNAEKTKILTYSLNQTTQPPDSLSLVAHSCSPSESDACNCPELKRVRTIKYLGVTLDNGLTFSSHIDLLTSRIRKLIYVFKTLRNVAEGGIVKRVYLALCQSLLTYCISAWGGAPKTILLKLERAQRAVLKVSTFRPMLFPTDELYKSCGVLTVRQLFIFHTVVSQHLQTPYVIVTKRRKDAVCQPQRCRLAFTKRFYCFLGPHLYNRLNRILKFYSFPSIILKKTVMNWLLEQNYTDTERLLLSGHKY